MSKKRTQRPAQKPAAKRVAPTPWQIGVLVAVLVLIAGVFWLKGRSAASEATAATPPALVTPTGEGIAEAQPLPDLLLPTEEAALPVAQGDLAPRAGELPEAHLERMMAEGQPILAFFHSYTCYQCTEMDKLVQQLHPDFAGQVALVDVNVYDDANRALLQRAGISVIPTMIFIDRAGAGQVYTGMMAVEELRDLFVTVAEGTLQ